MEMQDKTHDSPPVPKALLDALKARIPNRAPKQGTPIDQVWFDAGRADVVELIQTWFDRQFATPESE